MVHRFAPRCQIEPGHNPAPASAMVRCCWFPARGETTRPQGSAPWWSSLGAGLHVCARWCPTLPHPGGCSTIGAVRLSFRVRDGLPGVIPVAVTTETIVRAVLCCCLVLLFGYCLTATASHAHYLRVWALRGWVGCGPYSGRFAFTVSLTPLSPTHARRVWCVLGVLLFVLAY